MHDKPLESDWKYFRRRVPEWRERYLAAQNEEIASMLTADEGTPTERFWNTYERMKQEARTLTTCLDGHSRSKMFWYLTLMHRHGLIDDADLTGFSDELQAQLRRALQPLDW